mmetsp:Transcript_29251/g.57451  ORF Transcript_29251/g.57451 Transcript_29251/m.57451 type:complete len:142 (-) Transcript_29251:228-653(-)
MSDRQKAFALFSTNDGSGQITPDKLRRMMELLGHKDVSEEELEDIFRYTCKNRQGVIQFADFSSVLDDTSVKDQGDPVQEAFDVYDAENDGFITEDNVRELLRTLGEDPSPQELALMMKQADRDRDGKVGIEDFKGLAQAL